MTPTLTAIFATIFAWWFSTGLILLAVNRAAAWGYANVVVIAAPVVPLALYGLHWSGSGAGVAAHYVGFAAALALWGWIELAFLAGIIVGPDHKICPKNAEPLLRFGYALRAISYHEIALVVAAGIVLGLLREVPVQTGMWTFMILFVARISAKLNVFLGVPNINTEFLPRPVAHLASYFTVGPTTAFFPVAITGLTFATACWIERAVAHNSDPVTQTGFIVLATLTALATLEHWFMVLRLQDAALWRWLITPKDTKSTPNASRFRLDP